MKLKIMAFESMDEIQDSEIATDDIFIMPSVIDQNDLVREIDASGELIDTGIEVAVGLEAIYSSLKDATISTEEMKIINIAVHALQQKVGFKPMNSYALESLYSKENKVIHNVSLESIMDTIKTIIAAIIKKFEQAKEWVIRWFENLELKLNKLEKLTTVLSGMIKNTTTTRDKVSSLDIFKYLNIEGSIPSPDSFVRQFSDSLKLASNADSELSNYSKNIYSKLLEKVQDVREESFSLDLINLGETKTPPNITVDSNLSYTGSPLKMGNVTIYLTLPDFKKENFEKHIRGTSTFIGDTDSNSKSHNDKEATDVSGLKVQQIKEIISLVKNYCIAAKNTRRSISDGLIQQHKQLTTKLQSTLSNTGISSSEVKNLNKCMAMSSVLVKLSEQAIVAPRQYSINLCHKALSYARRSIIT